MESLRSHKPLFYVCFMNRTAHFIQRKLRQVILVIGILIGLLIIVNQAKAQVSKISLYGKVTTINGDAYKGYLRWGNDETYWTDFLNAQKSNNDFLKLLSKKEIEQISEKDGGNSWLGIDLGVLSIWEDKYSLTTHQFDAQFGDIKMIRPTGRGKGQVTMKNDVILELLGSGYEDIGASVSIYDDELGKVTINWDRLEKVEFMENEVGSQNGFGEPIYGKVNAGRKGTFTGTIQWDQGTTKNSHNERFLEDVLNGNDRDGDKAIPFKSIAKINKIRNGVDVTLQSGRQFFLTGSNDVNGENSGVLINDREVGQVVVPWREFESFESLQIMSQEQAYSDYKSPKGLRGKVITISGEEYSGMIAYDLDEAWEFEVLDGKDDRVNYKIPFKNIKNIIPKNYAYSMVILRNGVNLLLGDSRDVSQENDGVLVFTSKDSKPTYIRWSKIEEIIFD
ncbi:MAG: hypothetical protein ACJAS3_002529 [Roseivirga sp.]|jgi:hypothetical protein